MTLSFERPVGAPTDVSELEYVAALHQTDAHQIRQDASVLDEDIALFLSSRYGIQLSKEQVRERILEGFGSWKCDNADDEPQPCLDLLQIASLLLIPTLRKETIRMQKQQGQCTDENSSDPCLVPYVLDLILHDVTGRTEPVRLTTKFIRDLFLVYGETELANDDALLQDMIRVVTDPTISVIPRLTASTFAKLLTADLELYDIENEHRLSTNFSDVFNETHAELGRKADSPIRPTYFESKSKSRDVEAPDRSPAESMVPVKFSAHFMDLAADTYRSGYLVVALWTFFAVSFFSYYFRWDLHAMLPSCQSFRFRGRLLNQVDTFACTVARSVLRWLYILIGMGVYGIIYFGMAGIGNDIETTNPVLPLIGLITSVIWTTLASAFFRVLFGTEGVENKFLQITSVICGSSVALINLFHFVGLALPLLHSGARFPDWMTPRSIRAEALLKRAASHKIGKMVRNALDIQEKRTTDSVVETYFGQALFNYAESGHQTEQVGGFRWTWKGIWSRNLFRHEGMWFSGRLLSINISQFIVTLFILILGLVWTAWAVQNHNAPVGDVQEFLDSLFDLSVDTTLADATLQEVASTTSAFVVEGIAPLLSCDVDDAMLSCLSGTDDIEDCLPANHAGHLCTLVGYTEAANQADPEIQLQLLEASGFNVSAVYQETAENLAAAVVDPVNSLYPIESWMVLIPCLIGTLAAFLVALSHSVTVLPSVSTTVMKLRSGLIPFAKEPKARALRIAPDQVAYLQGSAFWGLLFSGGLIGVVLGGIAFLFTWQVTSSVAYWLLAGLVGIIVVILIHWGLVKSFRFVSSKAYYRSRPAVANTVVLARECAIFGLTVGFVLARVSKFLLTTLLYVGRIDTPFLADGVGELEIFGYRLDSTPYVFLIDILQHEAHRHPYIETLGVVYMMKLKHGAQFGNRVGSAWRLLFALALMPWLWKYRRLTRPQLEQQQGKDDDGSTIASLLSIVPLQPGASRFSLLTKQETLGRISLAPRQGELASVEIQTMRHRLRELEDEKAEKEAELKREVEELKDQLQIMDAMKMKGHGPARKQSEGLAPPIRGRLRPQISAGLAPLAEGGPRHEAPGVTPLSEGRPRRKNSAGLAPLVEGGRQHEAPGDN